MESFGEPKCAVVGCTFRKKRSTVSRRPRPDSQPLADSYNLLPLSSPSLIGSGRSDVNRNLGGSVVVFDGLGSENKPKRLKLKVGGVIRTVHTKSVVDFTKSSWSSDASRPPQKLILQEKRESSYSSHPDKGKNFQGVQMKEFSRSVSGFGKESSLQEKLSGDSASFNETNNCQPVRKSKRVPKSRFLDIGYSDDEQDEEMRYLGRLGASKIAKGKQNDSGMHFDNLEDCGSPRLDRDRNKLSSDNEYEDNDYVEEEHTSDFEPDLKTKKSRKGALDIEGGKKVTLITCNRAIHSSTDVLPDLDYPDGLPLVPPKKKKAKLSELEQQLKKAEVAQRRKIQMENAAKEAEAGAIRKILGQDSARKKREDKMKQQRGEIAQRKTESYASLASNTVRWVMSPTGTVVTFSEDVGLPNIFNWVPCSYPLPRETCVGPNCKNAYKYRDSKSKLPLCSLNCYRAIKKMQFIIAC